jgi:hypothetical protein
MWKFPETVRRLKPRFNLFFAGLIAALKRRSSTKS